MSDLQNDADEVIVCRCMEITDEEIKRAIRAGASTINAVKKMTGVCMGLCQGRTCEQLIHQLIAEETGINIGELNSRSVRPPVRPIKMKLIAEMDI